MAQAPRCLHRRISTGLEPLSSRWYDPVYYGHGMENVWTLIQALDAAGLSIGPFRDFFRQIWDYSLTYGYDHQQGSFFNIGKLGQPVYRY